MGAFTMDALLQLDFQAVAFKPVITCGYGLTLGIAVQSLFLQPAQTHLHGRAVNCEDEQCKFTVCLCETQESSTCCLQAHFGTASPML